MLLRKPIRRAAIDSKWVRAGEAGAGAKRQDRHGEATTSRGATGTGSRPPEKVSA